MNKTKICYLDLETGGLDREKSAVLQIGGIIEINGKIKEHFDINCHPFEDDTINQEALDVNGLTLDEIKTFGSPKQGHLDLLKIFDRYIDKYNKADKFYMCGFNIDGFDRPMLRNFFIKNGDTYFGSYFYRQTLDIQNLYPLFLLKSLYKMDSHKLIDISRAFDIKFKESKLHEACYDAKLCRRILKKMNKRKIKLFK